MKKLSLAAKYRIRHGADFKKIQLTGDRQATSLLLVNFYENQKKHPRLGLVVSKKISKKAVVRNRIKRQLREIFRAERQKIKSLDIVLIARPKILSANFAAIKESFQKALKQVEAYE